MADFPDNNFEDDALDDQYGGQPGDDFGEDTLQFLSGWVRSIAKRVLNQIRLVPYSVQVYTIQESVVPGDVLAMDLRLQASSTSGAAIPWIGKYSTIFAAAGASNLAIVGVASETKASGSRAAAAVSGPIGPEITGLTSLAAAGEVTADTTSGRLRAASGGDPVLGYGTPGGCVFLLAPGRAA